jgi:hypothetical protein
MACIGVRATVAYGRNQVLSVPSLQTLVQLMMSLRSVLSGRQVDAIIASLAVTM